MVQNDKNAPEPKTFSVPSKTFYYLKRYSAVTA